MTTIKELGGEFALIDKLTRKYTDEEVIKGVGDDCAVLKLSADLVQLVTTDMLVEDKHFKLDWASPSQVGFKAMEVNISDIAAMGGVPKWAFVSIAIPEDMEVEDIEAIYQGINASCQDNGVVILGGDTTNGDKLTINVAVLGLCETDVVKFRHTAEVGQLICVTGDLGRSEAGLQALLAGKRQDYPRAVRSHLEPVSLVALAREIAPHATSMIDVSDGLASEVHHICDESDVGAEVHESTIPLAEDTRMVAKALKGDPLEWALRGGEDFQLVFTATEEKLKTLADIDIPFAVIGKIIPKEEGRWLLDPDDGKKELPGGFDHFKKA